MGHWLAPRRCEVSASTHLLILQALPGEILRVGGRASSHSSCLGPWLGTSCPTGKRVHLQRQGHQGKAENIGAKDRGSPSDEFSGSL